MEGSPNKSCKLTKYKTQQCISIAWRTKISQYQKNYLKSSKHKFNQKQNRFIQITD